MSTISASTTSTTAYKVTADTTGTLVLQTGATPTTAMTISASQVVTFANQPTFTGGTANGVMYLNGSKVVTTGSALQFDGTNLTTKGIAPDLSNAYTLGTSSLKWNNVFTNALSDGTDQLIGSSGTMFRVGYGASWTAQSFAIGGSEQMRLTSTGLGIGTSSPVSRLDVRAASAVIGNYQQIQAFSTDTAAINLGGGISLGGYYSGVAGLASFGTIVGRKENSTDGNYAGYLAFGTNAQATGVVERARIDSSGNLLMGTTSALGYSGLVFNMKSSGTYLGLNASSSEARVFATWDTTAIPMTFYMGGTERMRIDSSGNVGIGLTNPTQKFEVNGNARITGSVYLGTSSDPGSIAPAIWAPATGTLGFWANSAERARIDTSGNLLVGTTSTSIISGWSMSANAIIGNGNFSGGGGMGVNSTSSTGTQYFIGFGRGGSNCGGITSTTTNSTSYLTSSDYRLKENVQPMTGALAKVAALKPCTYTWKEDGTSGQGFIAHELQAVVPEAVSGEKDAIDVEGNPRYQGVDTSFLVATLTAAIQEQQALITQLQADVAALKGAQ